MCIIRSTKRFCTDPELWCNARKGEQLAGRFFNAFGDPIDGGPEIEGQEVEIGGPSVNPVRRKQPSELIATGIAGIDLNNTLVSGQKIPFFADPDQPFNQVMANVALRAETDKIILGGMGMTNDDYLYFKNVFSNAGALDRIVSFMNTTENPPVERLLIPDMALTAAEYFAVEHNEKVLVLLTDMTSYADALAIPAIDKDVGTGWRLGVISGLGIHPPSAGWKMPAGMCSSTPARRKTITKRGQRTTMPSW